MLIDLLDLEQIEYNLFRGESWDIGSKNVFGGQVLGQALSAASRTVDADNPEQFRAAHSLHAYFILPGDMNIPILYEVERIRDGRSFTTRRVTAIQKGKAIFIMAASFQKEEEGLNHQLEMPQKPGPENLVSMAELRKMMAEYAPEKLKRFLLPKWPIEVRLIDPINPLQPEKRAPEQFVWFKTLEKLPDNQHIHKSAIAYASDFNLLMTSLLPHGVSFRTHKMKLASIDHVMWFHRKFRADEWLLYALSSPSASNARGLNFGHIYDQEGQLVATVAQEGLIRLV